MWRQNECWCCLNRDGIEVFLFFAFSRLHLFFYLRRSWCTDSDLISLENFQSFKIDFWNMGLKSARGETKSTSLEYHLKLVSKLNAKISWLKIVHFSFRKIYRFKVWVRVCVILGKHANTHLFFLHCCWNDDGKKYDGIFFFCANDWPQNNSITLNGNKV